MKWKEFKIFFYFLYPYRYKEALMFFLMLLGTVSGLASPYAIKIIIDKCIPEKNYQELLLILGVLLVIYALRLAAGYFSDYVSTWIANKVVHDIKTRLFYNLMNKPYTYFEENNPGDIIQKVNNEIHKIQHFLTNSILRLSNNVFTIIGLSVMLCLLDYKLFLISLSVFPIAVVLNRIWNKMISALIEKMSIAEGGIFNFYIDRIRNIKLIKNFNSKEREAGVLVAKLENLFNLYQRSAAYSSISRNTSTFFVVLGPLIVLGYGGFQVIDGLLTTGALVAFIQYMNRLYAPSNDMVSFYVDYVMAKVSMKRIIPLLVKDDIIDGGVDIPSAEGIRSVKVDDISFSYGENEVIRHLSFELTKGRKYAIAGLSGSGKSTILKLLCRMYDPKYGNIRINDSQTLAETNGTSWNKHINIIHQESLLFMESIRFNVAYGNELATDEDIWKVLADVKIESFVRELPGQLDTILGDGQNGIMLSGGQQQQIAIARAFLRGGEILILDEATSAIDSYKEQAILDAIAEKYSNKIVISVSHRLSAIRDLDEIIVLKDGHIAERGSHAALVALNGHYHTLFNNQLKSALPVNN